MTAEPLLAVERLTRRFAENEVLSGLDLTLEPGERRAIVGPNGSGKSTILRCVAGTLTPTSGSVLISGRVAGTVAARRLIGVSLSQERSFYLRLSGRANLEFFARIRGFGRREAAQRVAALAEELQLERFIDTRTDAYSTGMILQLAFARALLDDPPLVLLDEPTRSLDSAATRRLWDALDRRADAALLLATHVEHDVEHCHATLDLGA